MVNVTDRAKVALKNALANRADEPGVGLRVEISEQGTYALYPDQAKAGDQVVQHEGNALLLIGEDVSTPLAGATIDLADTPEGSRLVVTKPERPADEA
jgi:Fe-S cluster assembly iron-binding protein IscA